MTGDKEVRRLLREMERPGDREAREQIERDEATAIARALEPRTRRCSSLSHGERVLFAVAFDRAVIAGVDAKHAAVDARSAVETLRKAGDHPHIDHATRAMLDDMLGVPR